MLIKCLLLLLHCDSLQVLTGVMKQVLEGPEDVEFASWHGKG